MKQMEALVKDRPGPGASLAKVPVPVCGRDEVLIRVQASSICGTDLHIYNWDEWARNTVAVPNVFGHEYAGVVEQVGSEVTNVKPGDYVTSEGHFVCGVCRACRTGNAHVCTRTRSFGITVPGCFAEYTVVPASHVIHNHPDLPLKTACLQDPLGNAVHTVLAGSIVGKSVAIVGAGPIGLMAIAVAKACGAGTIFAVDVNGYRLKLAKQMGADIVLNSLENPDFADPIRSLTDGEGVEVLLEMSGHPGAIREALSAVANAGRVSLLGIPTKEVPINLAQSIIFKGLRVEGITGRRMYDTWYQMKGLLDSGRIDLQPLVTHSFKLEQYEEAFELVRSGQCGKVVFLHEG